MNSKAVFFYIFTLFTVTCFGQDKTTTSKKELNSSSAAPKQSEQKTTTLNTDFSNDDIDVWILLFKITLGIGYYGGIGDYEKEEHLNSNLTVYPYFDGESGNYETEDSIQIYKSRMRLDIENSFVYSSSNLIGNHLKVKLRPFQYFYAQSDFHQLFEFNAINETYDQLTVFQFNGCYDRIRFDTFNLGWTIGATYIGNEVRKTGLAFGLNAEYFMGNNISFMGSAKWSRINTLPVNTYEMQLRHHTKNHFFSLGFEHFKIATPTYNFIAIGAGIYF